MFVSPEEGSFEVHETRRRTYGLWGSYVCQPISAESLSTRHLGYFNFCLPCKNVPCKSERNRTNCKGPFPKAGAIHAWNRREIFEVFLGRQFIYAFRMIYRKLCLFTFGGCTVCRTAEVGYRDLSALMNPKRVVSWSRRKT